MAAPERAHARVGFVGLGNLGLPMARTLAADGWRLAVHDVAAGREVPEGAERVAAATELADCQAVCLAVPDDAAVLGLLEDPDGLLARLAPGSLVLVHSTVLPATARALAERAEVAGVGLVDAPVSGGAERAASGELTVMVGGRTEVVADARPLLETVGDEVRHVGPPGAGAAVKLANQLMMFAALAGAHEALDLAAAHGVAAEEVLAVVAGSTGDSWVARTWGFFDRVAHAYDAGATPVSERPWSKDLWEVTAAARAAGVRLPLAGLLAQTMADRVEEHARTAEERGRR
ncbi:NAD(P)-dependent oxidoreductase [Streptomyces triticirhizae]|uniref:NAD(P)-dependent oxidoreductase n=1 Tax=Streptomyces triticirhizae TaxID=2483353 RepID=A0A3M2M194_9ACTN|nr:NAD(P)-dependent oxidoreductase [Streptomyces triticirhizae]RMI42850.1 NAD(P)-dependent oxidoreductase [Streptomyces triticirhizae]